MGSVGGVAVPPAPLEASNTGFDDEVRPPETLWLLWTMKRSIAAVVAIVVGLMLVHLSHQPRVYLSSSEVLVPPATKSDENQLYHTGPNMEPARRLATSEAVKEGARARLGLPGTLPAVAVLAPKDTFTLIFSATSTSAQTAQRIVRAHVDAFVDLKKQEVTTKLADALRPIETNLADVSRELASVSDALATAVEPARSVLQPRFNALLNQRQTLEQQRNGLANAADLSATAVLTPATRPSSPAGPPRVKPVIVAFVLGGLLGCGQVFARSLVTPRLQGRRDLATGLRAPVLALVPRVRRERRELALAAPPASADQYYVLSATVLRLARHRGLRSILITSPNVGEGKSTVAANLAAGLARADTPTLLISAGRGTGAERYFAELGAEPTDDSDARPGPVLVPQPVATVDGLQIARLRAAGAGEVAFSPDTLRALLADLDGRPDLLVIDGQALLGSPGAVVLASLVDSVLVVASSGHTSRASLHEACLRLERVGAKTIGAVLTDVTRARAWFECRFDRDTSGFSWAQSPGGVPAPVIGLASGPLGDRRETWAV